jgi:hypothetical protein
LPAGCCSGGPIYVGSVPHTPFCDHNIIDSPAIPGYSDYPRTVAIPELRVFPTSRHRCCPPAHDVETLHSLRRYYRCRRVSVRTVWRRWSPSCWWRLERRGGVIPPNDNLDTNHHQYTIYSQCSCSGGGWGGIHVWGQHILCYRIQSGGSHTHQLRLVRGCFDRHQPCHSVQCCEC